MASLFRTQGYVDRALKLPGWCCKLLSICNIISLLRLPQSQLSITAVMFMDNKNAIKIESWETDWAAGILAMGSTAGTVTGEHVPQRAVKEQQHG